MFKHLSEHVLILSRLGEQNWAIQYQETKLLSNSPHSRYQNSNIWSNFFIYFGFVFLVPSLLWVLTDRGMLENLHFLPESLRVMLEFLILNMGHSLCLISHVQGKKKERNKMIVWPLAMPPRPVKSRRHLHTSCKLLPFASCLQPLLYQQLQWLKPLKNLSSVK